MDYLKGFDYLVDSWALVEPKFPCWHLDVFGKGDAHKYLKQASELKLKNIHFHDATREVNEELINSSIFVMTSRSESFSLVLLEAMSCGLPVVAFDCPTGPREMMENNCNGFLISKVGDVESMANALIKLMSNRDLRQRFGKRSLEISKRFHIDAIMEKWISLFESLCI